MADVNIVGAYIKMKLKITDEKLAEFGKEYDSKFIEDGNFRDSFHCAVSYGVGFRAAESHHQATVDKLMEIIEMQLLVLNRYSMIATSEDGKTFTYLAATTIIETDKMMKELK